MKENKGKIWVLYANIYGSTHINRRIITPALVGKTRQKTLILLKRKAASDSGSNWSSEYLELRFWYLIRGKLSVRGISRQMTQLRGHLTLQHQGPSPQSPDRGQPATSRRRSCSGAGRRGSGLRTPGVPGGRKSWEKSKRRRS